MEGAESVGPRVLELAATGCFFISDWRAELDEATGGLVPTFRNPQELEAMLRHYLVHGEECQRIARQLPAAVADWTFDRRVTEMVDHLQEV